MHKIRLYMMVATTGLLPWLGARAQPQAHETGRLLALHQLVLLELLLLREWLHSLRRANWPRRRQSCG